MYATVPPHVEYALTPLERSLVAKVKVLVGWAQENAVLIFRARPAYVPTTPNVAL